MTNTAGNITNLDTHRAMMAARDAHKAAHGALLDALFRWEWERDHDALAAAIEEERRTLHASIDAAAKYYGTREAP